MWVNSNFFPGFEALGATLDGRGYAATRSTIGPLLILSPVMKHGELPTRKGLCCHQAHLCASSDFVLHYEALGNPLKARFSVATKPTCGPLLILSLSLKFWESEVAHKWAWWLPLPCGGSPTLHIGE